MAISSIEAFAVRVLAALSVAVFCAAPVCAEDLESLTLPGFPLTAEDLSLVSRMTDPVEASKAVRPGFRERFMNWLRQSANRANDTSVFSALTREDDEPGVRFGIDTDTEEVTLEYRIGF